ncbi:antitoxin Xre-like helix-turn-helix domain-containing protein [Aliidiomarina sanyensis]|uniref:Antitoxin Xre-like helix-turn-helix domain-containing protein n=1 Tax=Aliidiomarina sanyensis TaxID=1249555 RepID=A0A432WPI9_9GAMM|nr:antitoxin Xre-like helix-turn-helix domain-containing protein [Aliidiomarina sanyensis]RUO35704.1 hypothetical protein CWE11_02795 [Aliidiomarina sanyensis]
MSYALSVNPIVFKERNNAYTLNDDQVAVSRFKRILEEWGVQPALWANILVGISIQTIEAPEQKLDQRLTPDQRERLFLVASYDDALKALFLQEQHRREWIQNKHQSLDGYSPLDILTCGSLLAMDELNDYLQRIIRS